MSTVMLGLFALLVFLLYTMGRSLMFLLFGGIGSFYYVSSYAAGPFGAPFSLWWMFATIVLACATTLTNIVLLAESRLALPAEDRVPTLRIGFFAQFVVLVLWVVALRSASAVDPLSLAAAFDVLGSVHLALVAAFAVTAGLDPGHGAPAAGRARWARLMPFLRAGTASAAAYVAVQMVMFVAFGSYLRDWDPSETRRLITIVGAILFFSGVPTLLAHQGRRFGMGPLHARGIALLLLAASLVLPDLLYYTFSGSDRPFTATFAARHLFSPARIPFNWNWLERHGWYVAPLMWALAGAVSYVALMRVAAPASSPEPRMTELGLAAGAAGDGDSR
jgi:hypothetical protein